MKKYIKPAVEAVAVQTEGFIAASGIIGGGSSNVGNGGNSGGNMSADSKENGGWNIW